MSGSKDTLNGRLLKKNVHNLLAKEDFFLQKEQLRSYDPVRLVSPLFAALCASSPRIRWHGISAFGLVLSDLAATRMEKARIVMRRFMWSLNDESGGIGWGAPEAMGEAMACHKGLAQEFHLVLVSYIYDNPVGPDNFLEYLPLRRGAFWGMARLAAAYPEFARKGSKFLLTAFVEENDAEVLGLACVIAASLRLGGAREYIQTLLEDTRTYELFWNGKFQTVVLGQEAAKSLQEIDRRD